MAKTATTKLPTEDQELAELQSVEFVALPPWNSNQHSNNNRNYSHTKGQHLRKWHKEKPGTKTTRSRWSVEVLSNTNRIRSTQRNVVQTGVIIQL